MGLRLVGVEIGPTLELDLALFTAHPPFADEVVCYILFGVYLEIIFRVAELVKSGVEPPD